MTATLEPVESATHATVAALDFDVIKRRYADIKKIDVDDVTDVALADFFHTTRETIWRFKTGRLNPSFPRALSMAALLDMSVYEISGGNPTPKPPSGPSTPKPAPAPPTPSKPKGEL